MEPRERFRAAADLARGIGAAGRTATEPELQELVESTETVWVKIDPHNAMELFSILVQALGPSNAPAFIALSLSALQLQPNYTQEVSRNSAAHCLVAAVLVNDRPDLLTADLIRSQARYLSSYSVSNCGYNADEIAMLQRHIGSHL